MALNNTNTCACTPAEGITSHYPTLDATMNGTKKAAHTKVLIINTGNTALLANDFFLNTS